MRRLPIAFILAIFLPLICACGDEPRDYGDFLTDIVTYEGSSDDGTAMFSFQTRDDLPLQRLASSIKLPSDIVAGPRCLPPSDLKVAEFADSDGTRQVRADGFAIIPTDGARKAPHSDMSTFPETEISVTSLWRSGTFINLNGWLPYSGKNYQLMLVADEQTLGSPTIEARIVYNTMGAQTLFDRRVYASFDVSALWSRATCRRLSIGIADRTFVFEKN